MLFRTCTKIVLFGLGILVALACLNSCAIFAPAPTLTVTADPDSGHPPFNVAIQATCSEEGGTYTLTVAGEGPVESNDGLFIAAVEGWPWKATVVWTDGKGTVLEATVGIMLENEIPVAHSLWTVPRNYEDRALILIDLRYLKHGCIAATGEPEFVSGFEDPDYTGDGNDGFTYHVEIEDMATGEFESVFYGPDRTLMGDEYVSSTIFYWFVNYTGEDPIYQYAVWSPMGCLPNPPSGGNEGTVGKRVHVYVMEKWGDDVRHWFYDVTASGSSCAHAMP